MTSSNQQTRNCHITETLLCRRVNKKLFTLLFFLKLLVESLFAFPFLCCILHFKAAVFPLKAALGRSPSRWNGEEHALDGTHYHKLTMCSPGSSETQIETGKGRGNQGTLKVPCCKIIEEALERNVNRIKTKIPAIFICVSWDFIVNDDSVLQKFIFSGKKK